MGISEPIGRRSAIELLSKALALASLPSCAFAATKASAAKKVYLDFTLEELQVAADPRAGISNWRETFDGLQKLGIAARADNPATTHSYGEGEKRLIDVHMKAVPRGAPSLIFIHGGGWHLGSKEDLAFFAPVLNAAGIAYLSPNYPLAPPSRMSEILAACRDCVIWVYRNAGKLGIDSNRIFVGGGSAGAHISAYLLTVDWSQYGLPKDVLKGGVLMSGSYDLTPTKMVAARSYLALSDEDVQAYSPVMHVSRMSAPILVTWADGDTPVARYQAQELVQKAKAAGIPVEQHIEQGKNHFDFAFVLADGSSEMSRKIIRLVKGGAS